MGKVDWRHLTRIPAVRTALVVVGFILIGLTPLVGPIPGPGGVIVFAAGLSLVLRYSEWAKRRYVRFKKKHPRKGDWADWGLRRRSAIRRQARQKASEGPSAPGGELTSTVASPTGAVDKGSLEGAPLKSDFQGTSDEAHLPAEQSRAQAPARLPGADGDGRGPQGPGGAARPRPQEALRVNPGLTALTRRSDYLAANGGRRIPMPGFLLLVRPRGDDDATMRVGITVTKKIGGAVVRNRMKRRFRSLARELLPEKGVAGADHVLIGRATGVERDYALLRAELEKALAKASR
jgi:ribonuclease P protein component